MNVILSAIQTDWGLQGHSGGVSFHIHASGGGGGAGEDGHQAPDLNNGGRGGAGDIKGAGC